MGNPFYYWATILVPLHKVVIMKMLRLFTIFLFVVQAQLVNAQRGVRIAYIDMDEILTNVEEYSTASTLLKKSVESWRKEIELKKMSLKAKEDQLQAEKILLTKELIEDRENELMDDREEIVELQNRYFGVNGRYIVQKNKLLQPVQDRILTLVREIAQERKYDFVFDRSSDLVMLYSAKNYDISALVLQRLNAQKRIKERKQQIEERKAKLKQRKN